MKKNRIFALALAVVLGLCSLTACNDTEAPDNTVIPGNEAEISDTTSIPDENEENTTEEKKGLDAYNWKYSDDDEMLKINGTPVTFDMIRYYVMFNKGYMDNGDAAYWTEETEKQYFELVENQLKYDYSNMLLAKKKGLELSAEDKTQITETVAFNETAMNAQAGQSFEEALSSMFLTKKVFTELVTTETYMQKLVESYVTDEQVQNSLANAQHILVDTEEKANDIYASIKDGKISFEDAAKEYSSCGSAQNGGNLGTFTKGQMVAEFEAAVFEMEIGEIRCPVKTEFGYHIIKKLPAETDKNSDAYMNAVYAVGYAPYQSEIDEFVKTVVIEKSDKYNTLTISNIGIPLEDEAAENNEAPETSEAENKETEEKTEADK